MTASAESDVALFHYFLGYLRGLGFYGGNEWIDRQDGPLTVSGKAGHGDMRSRWI